MGSESSSKASPRKFHVETRRRQTSTSWGVDNSNEPLSKLEVGTIHASVRSASSELEDLGYQLRAAKKKVRELTEAYKAMAVFIAKERALLSPIRALPSELIVHIFTHRASLSTTHVGSISAALSVSQVCRKWRKLAHATAVLWVRFPLYYLDDWRKTVPLHQVRLYRSWLARCGSLTCDVVLRQASPAMKERARQQENDAPEDDDSNIGLSTRFDSYYAGSGRQYLSRAHWSALDIEVPSDKPLELDSIGSTGIDRRSLPLVPLEKVKRCEMRSFPFANGLQVLHEAAELETLKWTVSYYSDAPSVPHVTATIHTLDLAIQDSLENGLSPLFDNLTAPQLATLQILWKYSSDVEGDASPSWESPNFIVFLTRSAASLTSLTLLQANICEEELITLLEHTPLLAHFSLSDRYGREDCYGCHVQMVGARLLRRLLPPSPGDLESETSVPLTPQLTSLTLCGGFDGNDIGDADIMRVFEARYPPGSTPERGYALLDVGAFHLSRPADHQLGGRVSLAERASRLCARGLAFEFSASDLVVDSDDEADSEGSASS
ncbi:hypothetical protein C8R46DRAFT_1304299 [Mycena filopes]|nr:hypothetical protein C8R46DRAFT_1304299 [Mycena filopes]